MTTLRILSFAGITLMMSFQLLSLRLCAQGKPSLQGAIMITGLVPMAFGLLAICYATAIADIAFHDPGFYNIFDRGMLIWFFPSFFAAFTGLAVVVLAAERTPLVQLVAGAGTLVVILLLAVLLAYLSARDKGGDLGMVCFLAAFLFFTATPAATGTVIFVTIRGEAAPVWNLLRLASLPISWWAVASMPLFEKVAEKTTWTWMAH